MTILANLTKGAFATGLGLLGIKIFRENNEPKVLEAETVLTSRLREAATKTRIEFKQAVENTRKDFDKNMNDKMNDMLGDFKKKLMNDDMWEAFDTIVYLVENVKKLDMEDKEYNSSVVLLLAILKKTKDLIKMEADDKEEDLYLERCPLWFPELSRGQRFGKYALNTYPASWESKPSLIAKEMGIEPENILLTKFEDDDVLCPKFILLLDHEVKSVVLAIRGTYCLKDIVIDMICDETPYLNGFAHKGILSGAKKVLNEAHECLVNVLGDHPGYGLVMTGHSLGAGVAELVTMELLFGEQGFLNPEVTPISCVALAPPPVFHSHDDVSTEVLEAIDIFINSDDCVPRMSLGSLTRLVLSLRAVDTLNLTVAEQFNILSEKEDEATAENLQKLILAVKSVEQDKFPFLQHPGKIFYMKKDKTKQEPKYSIWVEKSESFTGCLYLNEDMVSDHRKTSYEEALDIL